jgi:hypothetical protein
MHSLSNEFRFKRVFNEIYKNFIKKESFIDEKPYLVNEISLIFSDLYDAISNAKAQNSENAIIVTKNNKNFLNVYFPDLNLDELAFCEIEIPQEFSDLNLISLLYWNLYKKTNEQFN